MDLDLYAFPTSYGNYAYMDTIWHMVLPPESLQDAYWNRSRQKLSICKPRMAKGFRTIFVLLLYIFLKSFELQKIQAVGQTNVELRKEFHSPVKQQAGSRF